MATSTIPRIPNRRNRQVRAAEVGNARAAEARALGVGKTTAKKPATNAAAVAARRAAQNARAAEAKAAPAVEASKSTPIHPPTGDDPLEVLKAAHAKAKAGPRGKGTKLTDEQLTAYINEAKAMRPTTTAYIEQKAAYWLQGVAGGLAHFAVLFGSDPTDAVGTLRSAPKGPRSSEVSVILSRPGVIQNKGLRMTKAAAEARALKAWKDNGEQGERPVTPNLDAINDLHALKSQRLSRQAA